MPHNFKLVPYTMGMGTWPPPVGADIRWGYTSEDPYFVDTSGSRGIDNVYFGPICVQRPRWYQINSTEAAIKSTVTRSLCVYNFFDDFKTCCSQGIRNDSSFQGWQTLYPKWQNGLNVIWNDAYGTNERRAAECLEIAYMHEMPPAASIPCGVNNNKQTVAIRLPYFNGQPPAFTIREDFFVSDYIIWQAKINNECRAQKIEECTNCCKKRGLNSDGTTKFEFPYDIDWCYDPLDDNGSGGSGGGSLSIRSFGVSAFVGLTEINNIKQLLKNSLISYYPYDTISPTQLYNVGVNIDGPEINVNEIRKIAVNKIYNSINTSDDSSGGGGGGGGGEGNGTENEVIMKCRDACTSKFNDILSEDNKLPGVKGTLLTLPTADGADLDVWGRRYTGFSTDLDNDPPYLTLSGHMKRLNRFYGWTYRKCWAIWEDAIKNCAQTINVKETIKLQKGNMDFPYIPVTGDNPDEWTTHGGGARYRRP